MTQDLASAIADLLGGTESSSVTSRAALVAGSSPRPAEVGVRKPGSIGDDLLRGADQIASYLGLSRRQIYHAASNSQLPVFSDRRDVVRAPIDADRLDSGAGAARHLGRRPAPIG